MLFNILTSTISPHSAPPVKLMALAWNDNKRKLIATKPEGLQVDCAKEILSEQKTAMPLPPPWRTTSRHKWRQAAGTVYDAAHSPQRYALFSCVSLPTQAPQR